MALKPITDEELANLTRLQGELPDGYLVLTDQERMDLRQLVKELRVIVPHRDQRLWQEATAALYFLEG